MIWWVLGLLAVAVGSIGLFLWWGQKPLYHNDLSFEDLQSHVDGFVRQMDIGSTMTIERQGAVGFLQLALFSNQPDSQTVEFGFPEVSWSQGRFDLISRSLAEEGHLVQTEASDKGEAVPDAVGRFLRVKVAGSRPTLVDSVMQVMRTTRDCMAWPHEQKYRVSYSGAIGPQHMLELRSSLGRVPEGPVTRFLKRYFTRQLKRAGPPWSRK